MDILKAILGANGGQNIGQLASQFGIDESTARSAVENLVPSLARGLQKNAGSQDGMASLARALQGGKHARFLDDPSALGMGDTVSEGNKILGHVFGSKDVSRNVAANAAQKSGLDMGVLKKMLPLVATMVMGGMSKKAGSQASPSGMGDLLGSMLGGGGGDDDGFGLDDVLGMAKKLF